MDDASLKAQLSADAPPAQDVAFELGVLARIEQRRFRRELIRTLVLCAAAVLLLALIMPALAPALGKSLAPLLNNGVAATVLLLLTLGVPRLLAGRDY